MSLPITTAGEPLEPSPAVASTQDIVPPPRLHHRLIALFPPGQFFRYIGVGIWNTLFGFSTYALSVSLLGHLLPPRFLALSAILASLLSTPLNITMAYFGYKLLVFKTRGNYLVEWLRCFAVYGTGMIPGLLILSALTRLIQSILQNHHAWLSVTLADLIQALALSPASTVRIHRIAGGSNMAAYIAGAIVTGFTTIFSFIGHKTFSFKPQKSKPLAAVPEGSAHD